MNELKPFQKEGVEKMIHFLKHNKAVYNADEQGLGKTIQTAEVLNRFAKFGSLGSVLIIVPKIMLYTWEAELDKWLTYPLSIKICPTSASVTKKMFENYDIVITTYGIAATKYEELTEGTFWQILIADEAHYLKNRKAKRTKAVLNHISKHAAHFIALSGTPFKQNVVDGFTLFSKMAPTIFPNFLDFAGRYSYARATPYAIQYHGVRNAPELKKIIRETFYFRRTKKEVLPELPAKIFQKISLGPEYASKSPKTEREKLEAEIHAISAKLKEDGMTSVLNTSLAGERRVQAEIIAPAVAEFVEDLLDQDIPVVLGAYHKNVIASLELALRKYKPVVITGDTAAKLRTAHVADFQAGKTNLFIGQFTAAGVGITLTRSNVMVLAEPSYCPTELSQFIARCHRIGQEEILTVYYFSVLGSIFEDMIEIVMGKVRDFAQVVEN